MEKPRQSLAGLISISFGFLGIQFAFGLQNANVSRIFQSLGSSVDDLPFLWLAGPVTGLLVQPLIGHFSDHHWSRFGRRRPFFFAGAVLAALALFGFPHAGSLFAGAVFLWLLDASLNISMEPFRAFVGDMTRSDQRASGYAVQTVLIGSGAVLGSLAPAAFTALGVSNSAPEGLIPDSVRYALYLGGAAIFSAVLWTVMRVKEYSPQEMAAFNLQNDNVGDDENALTVPRKGWIWLMAGVLLLLLIAQFDLDKQLYVVGSALAGFGMLQIANQYGAAGNALRQILSDLVQMPASMRKLAVVQFFSWIALFIMWIFTTPVVTQYVYGSTDPTSQAYNAGAEWVGVLFAVYNGVSALAAFALPRSGQTNGCPAHTCPLPADRCYVICFNSGPQRCQRVDFADDRRWHRMVVNPDHALCHACGHFTAEKIGYLYGDIQFLRCFAPVADCDNHGCGHSVVFPGRSDLDDALRGICNGAGGSDDVPVP